MRGILYGGRIRGEGKDCERRVLAIVTGFARTLSRVDESKNNVTEMCCDTFI